mmetsp:Transcript_66845/g.207103  ORF Transcript_66845/g.207103 Transcript_66845/m.207103 type:complete len:366 (+) Transcript_66845:289-1386(+)
MQVWQWRRRQRRRAGRRKALRRHASRIGGRTDRCPDDSPLRRSRPRRASARSAPLSVGHPGSSSRWAARDTPRATREPGASRAPLGLQVPAPARRPGHAPEAAVPLAPPHQAESQGRTSRERKSSRVKPSKRSRGPAGAPKQSSRQAIFIGDMLVPARRPGGEWTVAALARAGSFSEAPPRATGRCARPSPAARARGERPQQSNGSTVSGESGSTARGACLRGVLLHTAAAHGTPQGFAGVKATGELPERITLHGLRSSPHSSPSLMSSLVPDGDHSEVDDRCLRRLPRRPRACPRAGVAAGLVEAPGPKPASGPGRSMKHVPSCCSAAAKAPGLPAPSSPQGARACNTAAGVARFTSTHLPPRR